MKRACRQSGIACLVALLLTACGGGGGGSGATSPGPAIVRAVDPAQARTYFAGSTAPGRTASQIHSEMEQLVGRIQGSVPGRSLLLSDISLFTTHDDLNLPVRLNTRCEASTCRYDNPPGVSLPNTVRAEDISLGPAASLRPVMRYRGILLTGGTEAIRIRGEAPDYPGWLDYSRFPVVSGGEVFSYGGWLDHSWFLVEGRPITLDNARDVSLYYGLSAGIAASPCQPPSPAPSCLPPPGSARWNGVMVATDVSGDGRENVIQGDAALSVDFGTATVDLSFSNVWDTEGNRRWGTAWRNMPVTAGALFSGTNVRGHTTGRFYGPGHKEAGGTFTYDDLTGAYGLKRQIPAWAWRYFAESTAMAPGPTLTASEAKDQVARLLGSIQRSQRSEKNGSLRVSDISLLTTRDDLSLPARVDATCSATTCSYSFPGISVSVGVDDLSVGSVPLSPVMRYRDIPLAAYGDRTMAFGESVEVFGYGGWLDYSGFLVAGETATSGVARDVTLYYGLSTGIASNSRPTGGSARWNGVMVATDVSGAGRENVIQGDAELSVDFGAPATVDLSFSDVRDLTTGTERPGTTWSDMPVMAAGEFSGTNARGETAGRFYGPGHEEVGGTFTYDDLAGAYGLKRQPGLTADMPPDRVMLPDPDRVMQAADRVRQGLRNIQGSPDGSLRLTDISLFTTRDDRASLMTREVPPAPLFTRDDEGRVDTEGRVDATCSTATCTYTYQGSPLPSIPGRPLENVLRDVDVGVGDLAVGSLPFSSVVQYREIPLAAYGGTTMADGVGAEVFGYGGWLDYSGFLAEGRTVTSGPARGISEYYGLSTGIESKSRPTGGSARWNGVMVATDVSGDGRENVIRGDAALSADFGAATVDLSFSNVRDLTAGATRPGIAWSDMPVTPAGEFSGTSALRGETAGRFYGPGHQEAGGTFIYDDLAGAYGLKRQ